jgi:hypothetical protein
MTEGSENPAANPEDPAAKIEEQPDSPRDPLALLVKAVGQLAPEERDLVYAWLLRLGWQQGRVPGIPGGWAVGGQLSTTPQLSTTQLGFIQDFVHRQGPVVLRGQPTAQQVVPVRFPAEQHAQLREWCAEHGFSMATVIRGLVTRFLEGQLPERN